MPLNTAQWAKVRLAYHADILSIAAIALKFGVSESAINRRRRQENWPSRSDRGLGFGRKRAADDDLPIAKQPSAAFNCVELQPDQHMSTILQSPILEPDGDDEQSEAAVRRLPHRKLLSILNGLLQKEITRMDKNNPDDPVQTETLKTVDHCFKLLERSRALSIENANTKPDSPTQPTGKQRADAADKLRHEIADRLERLQQQRRATAGPQDPQPKPPAID